MKGDGIDYEMVFPWERRLERHFEHPLSLRERVLRHSEGHPSKTILQNWKALGNTGLLPLTTAEIVPETTTNE